MRAVMRNWQAIRQHQTLFNTYLQVAMHNVDKCLVSTSCRTYMHDIKHVDRWTAGLGLTLQPLSNDDLVGFHFRLEYISVSSPWSSSMELISPLSRMPQGIRILEQ